MSLHRTCITSFVFVFFNNFLAACVTNTGRHIPFSKIKFSFKVQAWQSSRGPETDDMEDEPRSWCNGVHTALVALVEGRAGAGAATAARRALAAAWPLLLPTPQVRAHHLITLLPQGEPKMLM